MIFDDFRRLGNTHSAGGKSTTKRTRSIREPFKLNNTYQIYYIKINFSNEETQGEHARGKRQRGKGQALLARVTTAPHPSKMIYMIN